MNTSDNTYIWHLDARRDNLQLLRIILNERTTRLDFGYQTTDIYYHGGWINIFPETHLKSNLSEKKYRMQDQTNIVLSPNKYHFKSRADWHFFSLNFAPLSFQDQTLSLIEAEIPDSTHFNISHIHLICNQAMLLKL